MIILVFFHTLNFNILGQNYKLFINLISASFFTKNLFIKKIFFLKSYFLLTPLSSDDKIFLKI